MRYMTIEDRIVETASNVVMNSVLIIIAFGLWDYLGVTKLSICCYIGGALLTCQTIIEIYRLIKEMIKYKPTEEDNNVV